MTTTSLTTVSTDNAADVIKEVQDAFWDIPLTVNWPTKPE